MALQRYLRSNPSNLLGYRAKGIKITDGIKLAHNLTRSREIILDYLDKAKWSQGSLDVGQGGRRGGQSEAMLKLCPLLLAFKMDEEGHKPRNADGF